MACCRAQVFRERIGAATWDCYRGPVAEALGGADIAMLVGWPVSTVIYVVARWRRTAVRSERAVGQGFTTDRCGNGHKLTPDNPVSAERDTRWRCRQCGAERAGRGAVEVLWRRGQGSAGPTAEDSHNVPFSVAHRRAGETLAPLATEVITKSEESL